MRSLIKAGQTYEKIDEPYDSEPNQAKMDPHFDLTSDEEDILFSTEASPLVDEKVAVDDGPEKPKGSCSARYPPSIYFIVSNEFCERYSYYGMKAILVLYFTEILLLSDSDATTIYHTFSMLCYLTPIFGAMISDGWLGKYLTIFSLSWIYLLGSATMSLTALPPQTTGDPYLWGPLLGLLLIAIGTGGIKPCVAAFGGDQFGKDQAAEVAVFFSIFYFSINCGSLLSTFVTPILREDIQCFDNDCYALAFGVPAILLFVAIIIFIVGRYTVEYKMYPPQGNIVWLVCKTIGRALKNKSKYGKEKKYDHWLDYASDKYDAQLIKDTKILLHVLIMYIPLPVFWALFDQQGSRWTLQATQMNGNLGSFAIKPDQMQVLNPLLILLLIPIFDSIIYPCLRYCKIRCTHLQRMSWGMLFASIAFVCSALVQLAVNETVRVPPTNSESGLTLINAAPCDVVLESPGGQFEPISAPYTEFGEYVLTEPGAVFVDIKGNCSKTCAGLDLNLDKGKAFRVIAATFQENNGDKKLEAIQAEDKHEKPDRGLAYGSLVFTQLSSDRDYYKVELRGGGFTIELNASKEGNFFLTDWYEFEPATYSVHWNIQDDIMEEWTDTIKMESGAVYSVVFQKSQSDETIMVTHETVPANSVSILFQIPQYVIITTGEVMFSITGLEFSYAQAPASMKSCLQACWLLTVAGGNLIVILIAGATFISNQAYEFLFFAGLMLLVFFIFVGMSVCYTYVSPSHYDDFEEDEKKQKLGNGVEADEEKDPNAFAMTNPMDTTEGEK